MISRLRGGPQASPTSRARCSGPTSASAAPRRSTPRASGTARASRASDVRVVANLVPPADFCERSRPGSSRRPGAVRAAGSTAALAARLPASVATAVLGAARDRSRDAARAPAPRGSPPAGAGAHRVAAAGARQPRLQLRRGHLRRRSALRGRRRDDGLAPVPRAATSSARSSTWTAGSAASTSSGRGRPASSPRAGLRAKGPWRRSASCRRPAACRARSARLRPAAGRGAPCAESPGFAAPSVPTRSSPNISPEALSASETPSEKISRKSPGPSSTVRALVGGIGHQADHEAAAGQPLHRRRCAVRAHQHRRNVAGVDVASSAGAGSS